MATLDKNNKNCDTNISEGNFLKKGAPNGSSRLKPKMFLRFFASFLPF